MRLRLIKSEGLILIKWVWVSENLFLFDASLSLIFYKKWECYRELL